MNKNKILSLLKVLEITSKDQLLEKDILFWWNKKYIALKYEDYPIEQKNQDLINLNNAKDELEKLDSINLQKAFDSDDSYRNKYRKSKDNYKEDIEEDFTDDSSEEFEDIEKDFTDDSSEEFEDINENNKEDSEKNFKKESKWKKTSNSSNTYRSNQFNRFNDLKGQVGCLGSIVAFLLFIVIGDQIVRQHNLYILECSFENIFRTEEQIKSCARDKWGF